MGDMEVDHLCRLAVAAGCDLEGSELFVTDMDVMIELIHKNIALNGLQKVPELKVELLDWWVALSSRALCCLFELIFRRKDPVPEVIAVKPIDIVLAADCVPNIFVSFWLRCQQLNFYTGLF